MTCFGPKYQEFARPAARDAILADAVINTGKTLEPLLADEGIRIACCVINEQAVPRLEGRLLALGQGENRARPALTAPSLYGF